MLKETERINELKSHLLDLVSSSNDEKKLVKATKIMNKEKGDWWDELSDDEKKSLQKAIKDADDPKNLISHTAFKKTVSKMKKKWSSKS